MDLVFALVSDLHFGKETAFEGKLRKLTGQAPALTSAFIEKMNHAVRPDLIFNLGDDIEDESRALDLERYGQCIATLSRAKAPIYHVAGNHDLVNLTESDLLQFWGRSGRLYYSFEHGGVHFVVLHTQETQDVSVRIDDEQLAWLEGDLAAASCPTIVLMHHTASEQDLQKNRWFYRAPHLCKVVERRRLRHILQASGKVIAVFNGHLHWNHFDLCDAIPFVTVQSLIENLDDDTPGRAAGAHAICRLSDRRLIVEIEGNDLARYQFELPSERRP
ncbi:MAG TPA: metallophosphoesterase [Polyangiaceae bacterium]|nr:metallophosphoesterase [Polyangiaceae bacterium]